MKGGLRPPDPEHAPQPSLAERTSHSILWMTMQRWITRLGALATLMVLTRILAPEDFGLAGAATTLIPVLYVIADVGFSTYIVQAPEVSRRTLDTAFWFSLVCGAVLAAAVAVAAPLIGSLLDQPGVVPLVQVMAVSVLIVAFTSVPISLMRRGMQFRTLAVIEVSSALIAQVVAITAAFTGAGAWALVLQVLASQVVYGAIVWLRTRWRPGLTFSRSEFAEMARYGAPVVGSGLVVMSRSWIETVIVISALGIREMGFIIIAQRLVLTAQELSVSALLPVATAAFARVQGDGERLRSAYLRAAAIAYAAVTPLMLFVAVGAPLLVPLLFGEGKRTSAEIVPAVVAIVLLNVSWAIDQGLYLGTGRPLRWFLTVTVCAVFGLSALGVAASFGLAILLTIWVAVSAAEAVARWFVVAPVVKAGIWQVARPQLGVLVPSAFAVGAGILSMHLLTGVVVDLITLVITGLVVLAMYLLATRLLRPAVFADTVSVLPGRFGQPLRWAVPRRFRTVPREAVDA